MRSAVVVLVLLLLTGSTFSQQKGAASFHEVKGEGVEGSDFEFSASGYKYKILSSGRGTRALSDGAMRQFNLRLSKADYLHRVIYHAEYRGDLLLIYEVTNGESGEGCITRLDGRTMATKWKRSIPGFNVGPGLIEANYAYVTAIGFVGKVNLDSGTFAWKHGNLYRSGRKKGETYTDADFNSFELPEVEGSSVLFKEQEVRPLAPKTIKVHKLTGRIASIN